MLYPRTAATWPRLTCIVRVDVLNGHGWEMVYLSVWVEVFETLEDELGVGLGDVGFRHSGYFVLGC